MLLQAKKGTNYEALKEESDVFKAIKFPAKCSVCGEGERFFFTIMFSVL